MNKDNDSASNNACVLIRVVVAVVVIVIIIVILKTLLNLFLCEVVVPQYDHWRAVAYLLMTQYVTYSNTVPLSRVDHTVHKNTRATVITVI